MWLDFNDHKHWWLSCRFILENSVLDKHLRHILSIYPVVIWALTGVFTKNYNTTKPSRNNIFNGENHNRLPWHHLCLRTYSHQWSHTYLSAPVALLGVSCALLALRIVLFIWRHFRKPLLEDASPEVMSPMEIAERQKKIFKWEQWIFCNGKIRFLQQ